MNKIRIGKNIRFTWTLTYNGEAIDLGEYNVEVEITTPKRTKVVITPEVEGNVLTFEYKGKMTGAHYLTCYVDRYTNSETSCDQKDAFYICEKTYMEEDTQEGDLQTETIDLIGNMEGGAIGPKGPKGDKGDKGDPFTYDDFTPEQIEELQRPATEAAINANAAAVSAMDAAYKASTAADTANEAATNAGYAEQNANAAANDAWDKAQYAETQANLAKEYIDDIDGLFAAKADKQDLPNDVSRTATDATFVHVENGTIKKNLFYLRSATPSLAGLMTATDKTKLNSLPTSDFIPVAGQMKQLGFEFSNNLGTTLFTIPFADSTGGGLITLEDLTRFIDLGTKQELDAKFAKKQDKLPLIKGAGTNSMCTDYSNSAPGELGLAIGKDNYATRLGAVAIGNGNEAKQEWTFCLGEFNSTVGWDSCAIGTRNTILRHMGMAIGRYNVARAWGGVAMGLGVETFDNQTDDNNNGEIAIGRYNSPAKDKIFTIGCGTSNNDRKNAVEIDITGKVNFPQSNTSIENIKTSLNNKQDTLTAGKGIEIKDNIINVDLNKETSVDYSTKYFTTRALEDDCEIRLEIGSAVPTTVLTSISYSLDNGQTWTTTNNVDNEAVIITAPAIDKDEEIIWKGTGIGVSTTVDNNDRYSTSSVFYSTKKYEVEGNIMSLIYGDDFATQTTANEAGYNFAMLFYAKDKTSNLYSAKNLILPIKIVPQYCYLRMFQDSMQLKYAPKNIDADEIGYYSCMSMFYECKDLIEPIEELPAMVIGEDGYRALYSYCEKLPYISELPATTIAKQAYYQMCQRCYKLKKGPSVLPALDVGYETYRSMFWECYKLETPPEIYATTVGYAGMKQMFRDCKSLLYAPSELPATTIDAECYNEMFNGCISLIRAPKKLPATTLAEKCYYLMFNNCQSLTAVNDDPRVGEHFLPATTLAPYCYKAMFQLCKALRIQPILQATTLAEDCYFMMFGDSGISVTQPILPATTLAKQCYDGMYNNCTNVIFPPLLPNATLAENCYKDCFSWNINAREVRLMFDGTAEELAAANINKIVEFNHSAINPIACNWGKLYLASSTLANDDNFLKQFNGWDLYLNDVFVKKINVV